MTTSGPPPPSGPGGTDLEPILKIASRADLVTHSSTPAPTFTLAGSYRITVFPVVLNPGESIVSINTCTIDGGGTPANGFVGNFDGPLISGNLSVAGIVAINNSAHADAFGYQLSSDGSRIPAITHCVAGGPGGSLEVIGVVGPATVTEFAAVAAARGCVFRGGIIDNVEIGGLKCLSASPGYVGLQVEATTTVTQLLKITSPIFSADMSQWGMAFADAVTVSADALIQVTSSTDSGPQSQMIRQDPGDMDVNDDRLLISGSSANNWAATIEASRTDLASPLLVSYPAFPAADPTLIPYWTGAGLQIMLDSGTHWTLVKDDPGVGDWYLEFVGEKSNAPHVLGFSVLVDRAAGTGFIEMSFERNGNPGVDDYAQVSSTVRKFENTNTVKQFEGGGSAFFDKGDRIRLTSDNLADAVNARIFELHITGRGV